MTAIAGLRGTGDWATDERPKNFREMILWLNPNGRAPLTALMSRIRSERVDDPEFNWWEETLDIVRVTVTTDMATAVASTAVAVSGGGALNLVPGDLLMVEGDSASHTNEMLEVSSVTSDTAFVVKRGAAGTTNAQILSTTVLLKIGNMYAEGTNSPDVSQRNPTKKSNYCQIFKTAYELTKTAEMTRTRTGDPLQNDKKRKAFDHSVAMEHQFLWGVANEDTGANGKPRRTTAGIRSFLTSNVKIWTTTPTEDTFLDEVYSVWDFNNGGSGMERLCFAGNGALNTMNKVAKNATNSRINHTDTVKFFGMELQRWSLPQGNLLIKTHPLLNIHPVYTYSMFIIDPAALVYRYMRDTKPMDNIQDNDADTRKGQWLSEVGLEVHHERTMAYFGNVQ